MLTLPIQVGKRYVRRDGVVVEARQGSGWGTILFVGDDDANADHYVYASNGRISYGDQPRLFDLVADADEARAQVSGIEAQVCQDIAARQAKGIATYGCTVAENPLQHRAWLQHAYEECLDQAVYLRRAIDALDKSAV